MKKRGGIGLWILIILVLIVVSIGIYLFIHSRQPMLKDSDGNDPYTKGMIYERMWWGWMAHSGDKCVENSVQEKIVRKDSEVVGRYYSTMDTQECPNGCQDGACIK